MKETKEKKEKKSPFKKRMSAIGVSLLVSTILMGVKFYTFHLTRSSAVLSDALESIINVVAAGFAAVSIWMAAQPADSKHPYGHGKIEYFSAGFEGALIIVAAMGIFKTGVSHLLSPKPLANLDQGLVMLVGAAFINLLLGIGLTRVGKKTESMALVADGKHVLTDVYTSGGVVVGLFLVRFTHWTWLDGSIACLVGISILVTGIQLVRQSYSALMHTSDPNLLESISQLLEKHRKPVWIDIHQLRAWRSGNFVNIDLHLVLPRDHRLDQAHAEADELERLLIDYFNGDASVLIHMDPCGIPVVNNVEIPCWENCREQKLIPDKSEGHGPFIKIGTGRDFRHTGKKI